MKYFSVNKLVEEIGNICDYKFETLVFILSGKSMYRDQFNSSNGVPCLIKIISKKAGDKIVKFEEFKDFFGDDITIQIQLPRQFTDEFIACKVDVTRTVPYERDGIEKEYYPRTFAKLSPAVLKLVQEQQKQINDHAGIESELFSL